MHFLYIPAPEPLHHRIRGRGTAQPTAEHRLFRIGQRVVDRGEQRKLDRVLKLRFRGQGLPRDRGQQPVNSPTRMASPRSVSGS